MIVWVEEQYLASLRKTAGHWSGVRLGTLRESPADSPSEQGALLVSATSTEMKGLGGEVHLLVPAGMGADIFLLSSLAQTGLPMAVCVNGLGFLALEKVREAVGPGLHLALDARGLEALDYHRQMLWLKAQSEPFIVLLDTTDQLMCSLIAGPTGIALSGSAALSLPDLGSLFEMVHGGAYKPISPREVDGIAERETSLTVHTSLSPGHQLATQDLCAGMTKTRGLSPSMLTAVAGLRLRYAIAPGEALTFGHFSGEA